MTERCHRIERELESLIVEELLDQEYDGRDPLEAKIADSLALEQLAEHIAEEYGVRLSDEEMVEESTFQSIPALAALVDRRMPEVRT